MNRYAKRGLLESGPSRKDSAAGGRRAAKVPQARPETEPEAVLEDYWATAKRLYLKGSYPDYGSPEWQALPDRDPRKQAGLIAFGELWRKFGDEIAEDFNRQLRAPQELVHRATDEACAKAWTGLLAQQERRRKGAA